MNVLLSAPLTALAGFVFGYGLMTTLRAFLRSWHTRRCERLWFACRSPFHR